MKTAVISSVAVVAALAMRPAAVHAQTRAADWSKLEDSRQSVVYVQDDSGAETKGRLLRIDPASLALQVDGIERQFDAKRVKRVQKRDSFRNGAIIGAVVGATFGLIGVGIADCPGNDPSGDCPGVKAALYAFAIGTYSAIGIGIDALIPGRTTLYEAPAIGQWPAPGRRFARSVPPRAAFGVTFGW